MSITDVDEISEDQIKPLLLGLGILRDDSKNPVKDMVHAWELLQSYVGVGTGFTLTVYTTDACNGYGSIEHWSVSLLKFEEWCSICVKDENHFGRHRWARNWNTKHFATALTPQAAICKALILEATSAER